MRSNGLTAATYTPVADIEPPIAAALLDDLRALGVAAYTTPVQSTSTPGFNGPEFLDGVRDRLYVDAASAAKVRDLIASRDPNLIDDNEDLTFAQLVAGFDRPLGGTAPWPVAEDLAVDDARLTDERDTAAAQAKTDLDDEQPQRRWGDGLDDDRSSDGEFLAVTWRARPESDEDHFVPEPPAPLPHLEPYKQLAWAGVVGGPLALLIAALTGVSFPGWLSWFAIVGFIGGFVTLVATMSDDDDWDPDDGAVV
jgi:hypothetical protein